MGNRGGGLPGVHTTRTATPRNVLLAGEGVYLPKNIIINGTDSRDPTNTGDVQYLQAGILLGKQTSGSKYAPSILGVTTVAYDQDGSANLQITVAAATATEIVRRIGATGTFKMTGPPSTAGTVATQTATYSGVNTSTGVITIADLAADAIAGSFIQDTDGSEAPLAMIGDGYPVKVTDDDESSQDQEGSLLVAGLIDSSQIVNWPSDASLRNWIMSKLNGGAAATPAFGPYIFDHRY